LKINTKQTMLKEQWEVNINLMGLKKKFI